jgi:hypothetical protein
MFKHRASLFYRKRVVETNQRDGLLENRLFLSEVFRSNVAGTVHDAEQLNTVFDGAIENEVAANWKTVEIRAEFLNMAAHIWRGCDDAQSSVKMFDKPVGGEKVAHGNVAP